MTLYRLFAYLSVAGCIGALYYSMTADAAYWLAGAAVWTFMAELKEAS